MGMIGCGDCYGINIFFFFEYDLEIGVVFGGREGFYIMGGGVIKIYII